MYANVVTTATEELTELKKEYMEFKHNNSLDEYFTKYTTLESKKRLLEQIAELKKETDWGYSDPLDLDRL